MSERRDAATTNRLAEAGSAYLKSAAHQPVDWYPWGAEAFERARESDKPILLDVGAVWCHWCHVMDRESYEDAEVARLINESFVPVKVDRDERPDVDRRYQRAVGAITGQGGWPLTAFLTPQGNVFYGGTYFPPRPAHGRPSFREVLARVATVYRDHPAQVQDQAEALVEAVNRPIEDVVDAGAEPPASALELAERAMERACDPAYGGFGQAPKFPHPGAVELLYARHALTGRDHLQEMASRTLEAMAKGGIRDHVGGGFHRYSVDRRWIVPHFEKMAYDNAELLRAYAVGWQATGRELFRESALETVRFFHEVLMDPRGGFYGSQDADVDLHDDGDYFTWSPAEVDAALPPEEAEVIKLHYHVHAEGEMHHDPSRNVLFLSLSAEDIARRSGRDPEEVAELIRRGRQGLRRARAERRAPYVDRTLYVNWNGLCISAYCRAYRAFAGGSAAGPPGAAPGETSEGPAVPVEHLREFAVRSFERLWAEARDEERGFAHSLRDGEAAVWGLVDDQVKMGLAALDLFEITGDSSLLARAEAIAALLLRDYADEEVGGFFDVACDREEHAAPLARRQKPIEDDPVPSANGTAAQFLLRLGRLTGEEAHRETARRTLAALAGAAAVLAYHGTAYLLALDAFFNPGPHVVVVGDETDATARRLREVAWATWRPHTIVHPLAPERLAGVGLPPEVRAMLEAGGADRARAYVCVEGACAPPTGDVGELASLIRSFGRPSPAEGPAAARRAATSTEAGPP